MSEMDLTAAERKATYEEIKERENYNTQKSDSCLQLICPVEKEKAIKDAFKYFKMI